MSKPYNRSLLHWSYRIDRYKLMAALGLPINSPIPKDYTDQRKVYLTNYSGATLVWEVKVNPARKPQWGHRIMARCHACHEWIPFGRMHQHTGNKECLKTRDKNYKMECVEVKAIAI